VEFDVYRPAVYPLQALKLVIFNDGQDLRRMGTRRTLQDLYDDDKLTSTLVVGIVAADRLREYGTSERLDYKQRGDLATGHELFVIRELIPWLEKRYTIHSNPDCRAVAGFSLGGLNAFDLVWRNPHCFSTAGVFSGALWWRSTAYRNEQPDADRIVHNYVVKEAVSENFRAWFMAGTEDEHNDRNHNGIIDAIDDTLDLHYILTKKGMANEHRLSYLEVPGGQHNPDTWARVMGEFLQWL
ncbi:MAG: alpha/beta hydrolase-fold protein, partial [Bacteroidota bacterium]